MKLHGKTFRGNTGAKGGFTLTEVVITLAILGMVFEGVVLGYVRFTQMSDWSSHSLAAQSLASQGAEQARAAKWDTRAWPQGVGAGTSDELGVTSYVQINTLDVAVNGQPIIATNFISVTTVSVSPPVRQIRSDCVWKFMGRGSFTNTVVMLRAADQ